MWNACWYIGDAIIVKAFKYFWVFGIVAFLGCLIGKLFAPEQSLSFANQILQTKLLQMAAVLLPPIGLVVSLIPIYQASQLFIKNCSKHQVFLVFQFFYRSVAASALGSLVCHLGDYLLNPSKQLVLMVGMSAYIGVITAFMGWVVFRHKRNT